MYILCIYIYINIYIYIYVYVYVYLRTPYLLSLTNFSTLYLQESRRTLKLIVLTIVSGHIFECTVYLPTYQYTPYTNTGVYTHTPMQQTKEYIGINFMCICIYIYIYIYMYLYRYMCVYIYMYIFIYIYMYICRYICILNI